MDFPWMLDLEKRVGHVDEVKASGTCFCRRASQSTPREQGHRLKTRAAWLDFGGAVVFELFLADLTLPLGL